MSIASQIEQFQKEIHPGRLIAVSKFHPVSAILEAYAAGQRDFGENRVQELCQKHDALPEDIRWHMIGTLQRNKVKYIVPFIYCIHSVDNLRLLDEIEKEAAKSGRIISCLMQVHIAREETKHGFAPEELFTFFASESWKNYKHISFCGLMGMATLTENQSQINAEFESLHTLYKKVQPLADPTVFKELSMGMSSDYACALQHGSTMVRIGSSIFGQRN